MTPEERQVADNWIWAITQFRGQLRENQQIILPPDLYELVKLREKELLEPHGQR